MKSLTNNKAKHSVDKTKSSLELKAEKEKLLHELFGCWSDIDCEKLIKDIYDTRSITTGDDINFE